MRKLLLAGAALVGLTALSAPAFAQARTEGANSDAPAATNTRSRLAAGQSATGNIGVAGDADWYRVQLEAGQEYRIALRTAEGDNGLGDPYLTIRNARGEEVVSDDDGGGNLNSYLEFSPEARGTYFLEAKGFSDQATGRYTLTLAAGEIPADATTDVAIDSANGGYRQSTLNPAGDRDWFRLQLGEGETVRVALMSAGEGPDALSDPYLTIKDANGADLVSDDDGGDSLNSYIEFAAPSEGVYYLEARGFSEEAVGQYAISVTPGEIGGDPGSGEIIAPNGDPRASVINPAGDRDSFAVDMIEGRTYRFNLTGEGDNPLSDPYLSLVDGENNQVSADDDGGTGLNAYLTFIAPQSGTYFATVSAFADSGAGAYVLRVSDTEIPGHQGTDEYLTLGSDGVDSRASRVDMPGDKDWFHVDLQAGQAYGITLNSYGANPLGDPVVAIYGESGEQIATDDDGGDEGMNALLRFTPQQSGGFYIEASGFGQTTGEYELTVGPAPEPAPPPPATTRRPRH